MAKKTKTKAVDLDSIVVETKRNQNWFITKDQEKQWATEPATDDQKERMDERGIKYASTVSRLVAMEKLRDHHLDQPLHPNSRNGLIKMGVDPTKLEGLTNRDGDYLFSKLKRRRG